MSGSFVHPTAIVDEPVEIGAGTNVWHLPQILMSSKKDTNAMPSHSPQGSSRRV